MGKHKRDIQKYEYFEPFGIVTFRDGVKNQNTLQESIRSKLLFQTGLFWLGWRAWGFLEGWWAELTYTTPSTVRPDRSTNCLPKSYLFKYKSEPKKKTKTKQKDFTITCLHLHWDATVRWLTVSCSVTHLSTKRKHMPNWSSAHIF